METYAVRYDCGDDSEFFTFQNPSEIEKRLDCTAELMIGAEASLR